jgi:hypothetical protein
MYEYVCVCNNSDNQNPPTHTQKKNSLKDIRRNEEEEKNEDIRRKSERERKQTKLYHQDREWI